jgi:hypothetical protein
VYPHELEELVGDPVLFKVRKDCGSDSDGSISVEVVDFLIDANVLEIYLDPSHDCYACSVCYIMVSLLIYFFYFIIYWIRLYVYMILSCIFFVGSIR